jgi:HNH endonuclease
MFYDGGYCLFPGCPKPHKSRGYCSTHYDRLRKYGDVNANRKCKTPAEQLAEHTEHRPNGCLEWTGTVNRDGYGRLLVNGRWWLAHRLAWSLANEEDPGRRRVRHTCDNPPCCDARHLVIGSQADNVADMHERGRYVSRKGRPNKAKS